METINNLEIEKANLRQEFYIIRNKKRKNVSPQQREVLERVEKMIGRINYKNYLERSRYIPEIERALRNIILKTEDTLENQAGLSMFTFFYVLFVLGISDILFSKSKIVFGIMFVLVPVIKWHLTHLLDEISLPCLKEYHL